MVHVVGVWDTIVSVEAVGGWQHFLVVTEVPLAKTGGGVTLGFQVVGDGVFLGVQPLGR